MSADDDLQPYTDAITELVHERAAQSALAIKWLEEGPDASQGFGGALSEWGEQITLRIVPAFEGLTAAIERTMLAIEPYLSNAYRRRIHKARAIAAHRARVAARKAS